MPMDWEKHSGAKQTADGQDPLLQETIYTSFLVACKGLFFFLFYENLFVLEVQQVAKYWSVLFYLEI